MGSSGADPAAGPPSTHDPWSARRWWWVVAALATAGLAVRVAYVLVWMDPSALPGDAAYYHYGANLLADGHGFVNPTFFLHSHGRVAVPAAQHPPGYVVFLAASSLLGLRGPLAHQLWSSLLGTGSVVVIALLARRVAGPRSGIAAAALAALYPNLWLLDGMLHSETLVVFAVAVVTYLAYRQLSTPGTGGALILGAVCGAAALVRAEQVLLLPLLAAPAAYIGTTGSRVRRAGTAGLAVLAGLLVIAPWSLYNLSRFERPVPLTTEGGTTLAVANCDLTYRVPDALGSWAFSCWRDSSSTEPSVVDAEARSDAIRYMRDHAGRLPVVLAARLGRTWGLYQPLRTLAKDRWGKPQDLTDLGGVLYYPVVAAAIIGGVEMRRRRVPVWPLLVHVFVASVVSLGVYGTPRFRAGAEVALVTLAAAALGTATSARRAAAAPGDLEREEAGEARRAVPTSPARARSRGGVATVTPRDPYAP